MKGRGWLQTFGVSYLLLFSIFSAAVFLGYKMVTRPAAAPAPPVLIEPATAPSKMAQGLMVVLGQPQRVEQKKGRAIAEWSGDRGSWTITASVKATP